MLLKYMFQCVLDEWVNRQITNVLIYLPFLHEGRTRCRWWKCISSTGGACTDSTQAVVSMIPRWERFCANIASRCPSPSRAITTTNFVPWHIYARYVYSCNLLFCYNSGYIFFILLLLLIWFLLVEAGSLSLLQLPGCFAQNGAWPRCLGRCVCYCTNFTYSLSLIHPLTYLLYFQRCESARYIWSLRILSYYSYHNTYLSSSIGETWPLYRVVGSVSRTRSQGTVAASNRYFFHCLYSLRMFDYFDCEQRLENERRIASGLAPLPPPTFIDNMTRPIKVPKYVT